MLGWVGNDQPMKMRETSRAVDKKPQVNNIPKKRPEILEIEIPKIKDNFIKTMNKKYNMNIEEAENIVQSFIQVFIDASGYSFSRNHSIPYSYLGYALAWLRYYYPLEFITASLNINTGKEEKTARLIDYAKSKGIEIRQIKFGYSRAGYMFDKETNSIYQGIEPIKFLNSQVAESLYELRDRKYNSFVDLLIDIKDGTQTVEIANLVEYEIEVPYENEAGESEIKLVKQYEANFDNVIKMPYREFLTKDFSKADMAKLNKLEKVNGIKYNGSSITVNSRQMNILISLNFFSEFGNNKKLLKLYQAFDKTYKATHKLKTKQERYAKLLKLESELANESLSLVEQCESELEYLGHIETINNTMPHNILFITEVQKNKTYARAKAYQFSTGEIREFKIGNKVYSQVPFEEKDVIQIVDAQVKPKNKRINGTWQPSPTEKEVWLKEVKFIRKGSASIE